MASHRGRISEQSNRLEIGEQEARISLREDRCFGTAAVLRGVVVAELASVPMRSPHAA
jgi:hypothetical protein